MTAQNTEVFNLSTIISQKTWFEKGDVGDDCWVISPINLVWAITPWITATNVRLFREAAGKPDDPNKADGGRPELIVEGTLGRYPIYAGKLRIYKNADKSVVDDLLSKGYGLSIAVMPGHLPANLRHGVGDVPHQCSVVKVGNVVKFANPWASMPDRWDDTKLDSFWLAMRAYTNGNGGTFVRFPRPSEMLPFHPAYPKVAPPPDTTVIENAAWNSALESAANITANAAGMIRAQKRT